MRQRFPLARLFFIREIGIILSSHKCNHWLACRILCRHHSLFFFRSHKECTHNSHTCCSPPFISTLRNFSPFIFQKCLSWTWKTSPSPLPPTIAGRTVLTQWIITTLNPRHSRPQSPLKYFHYGHKYYTLIY